MKAETTKTINKSKREEIVKNGKLIGKKKETMISRGTCYIYLYEDELYCLVYESDDETWLIFIVSFDKSELALFVDDYEEAKKLIEL